MSQKLSPAVRWERKAKMSKVYQKSSRSSVYALIREARLTAAERDAALKAMENAETIADAILWVRDKLAAVGNFFLQAATSSLFSAAANPPRFFCTKRPAGSHRRAFTDKWRRPSATTRFDWKQAVNRLAIGSVVRARRIPAAARAIAARRAPRFIVKFAECAPRSASGTSLARGATIAPHL
jgi:hypothetical protein